MNKQETVQVITILASNYDNIANKTGQQKVAMINTWLECLGDLDYQVVLQAVKKCIIESPYLPTIHDIRKNVIENQKLFNSSNCNFNSCYWYANLKYFCDRDGIPYYDITKGPDYPLPPFKK